MMRAERRFNRHARQAAYGNAYAFGSFCSARGIAGGPDMKIAQIAPLMESVPPRLYGGTERIVSWLCEDLVAQGHDVTLFASADSITSAELVPCATEALRLRPDVVRVGQRPRDH